MSSDFRPDNTNRLLTGMARPRKVNEYRMKIPAAFICAECKSQTWRIVCESHPQGDAAVYFECPDCKARTPIMQLRALQLSDHTAKEAGLWTPDQLVPVEFDIDVE